MSPSAFRAGLLTVVGLCAVLVGCASDTGPEPIDPEDDLFHPSPGRRLAAVQSVAEARDESYLPVLVDLLEDPDASVRMAANQALEELSGFETDYRAFAPVGERRTYIADWRAWLADPARGAPATEPVPDPVGAGFPPPAADTVTVDASGLPPAGPLPQLPFERGSE